MLKEEGETIYLISNFEILLLDELGTTIVKI